MPREKKHIYTAGTVVAEQEGRMEGEDGGKRPGCVVLSSAEPVLAATQ